MITELSPSAIIKGAKGESEALGMSIAVEGFSRALNAAVKNNVLSDGEAWRIFDAAGVYGHEVAAAIDEIMRA